MAAIFAESAQPAGRTQLRLSLSLSTYTGTAGLSHPNYTSSDIPLVEHSILTLQDCRRILIIPDMSFNISEDSILILSSVHVI